MRDSLFSELYVRVYDCVCECAYCCPCPSEGSYEEQIRVSNRKPLSPRPVVIVLRAHPWLTPPSPCRHVHLSVSKSGRHGASYRFCSLTLGKASASGFVFNVGMTGRWHTRLLPPRFCTIFWHLLHVWLRANCTLGWLVKTFPNTSRTSFLLTTDENL